MSRDERRVLYLNVTAFPIEIERVLDSNLMGRPVAIAPLKSDRSLLWEVSKESREWGVEKGMPLAQAKKICRDLILLPPKPDLYKKINREMEEKVLAKTTPLYEIEKPGHAYLDLTGFEKIYGASGDMATRIQNHMKNELSLFPSIGSSSNKLISKVAAKSVRDSREICLVNPNEKSEFLSPLPVEVLPIIRRMMKKSSKNKDSIFEDLNLHHVSDLLGLNPYGMEVAFGSHAERVMEMARGVDTTPVFAPYKEEVIFEEGYLKEDTNDLIHLRQTLNTLLESATNRMRKEGLYAGKIGLSLRYSDYKLVTKEKKLKEVGQNAHDFEELLFKMFHDLFKRRTMIQFLGLEFKDLRKSEIQLKLFETTQKEISFNQNKVMDSIKLKFGDDLIKLGKEVG